MKRHYIFGMLMSVIMTGCAGNGKSNGNISGTTDNKEIANFGELADITIGGVKFNKAKNMAAGKIEITGDTVKFVAGPQTDYFRSPDGNVTNSSPIIFTEIDNAKPFTFTAKVNPKFTETGTYSAGVLYVYENDTHCQKLCFEQDEYGEHRVVTVRTIGTSDDNNHQSIPGDAVYMRFHQTVRLSELTIPKMARSGTWLVFTEMTSLINFSLV